MAKCYALKHRPKRFCDGGRKLSIVDGSVESHVRNPRCAGYRPEPKRTFEHARLPRRVPDHPELPNNLFLIYHGTRQIAEKISTFRTL
jgi:hypothetical protein